MPYWQKNRTHFFKVLPSYINFASAVIGFELAFLQYKGWIFSFSEFTNKTPDWSISVFMLAGSMAGFSAAGLAIVAGLSVSDKTNGIIESEAGGYLIASLLNAMWAWLAMIGTPVLHYVDYSTASICYFMFILPICIGKIILSYIAFNLLMLHYIRR